MTADTLAERIKKFLNNRGVKICLCILFFFFRSIRTTNNTSFLTFTQTHIPLIIVSELFKKKERDIERDREGNVSSVFILVPVEYSQQTGRIPAVTPVCTSSGEDASADMLYGDINLANHRANGESS